MADEKKEKKKKKSTKKEEPGAPEPAAAPAEAPPPEPEKKASSRGSKKQAARTGSNVFSMFSQKQVAEFKEGFQLMDADKDGVLGKADLRQTFDIIGRIANDKELDEMLNDAPGPISFTMLLNMFAERMSGGSDDDDVVIAALKAFDEHGKIDTEGLRSLLMTFGDKFSGKECDDAFEQFPVDANGKVDTAVVIATLTASAKEEEEEEAS